MTLDGAVILFFAACAILVAFVIGMARREAKNAEREAQSAFDAYMAEMAKPPRFDAIEQEALAQIELDRKRRRPPLV